MRQQYRQTTEIERHRLPFSVQQCLNCAITTVTLQALLSRMQNTLHIAQSFPFQFNKKYLSAEEINPCTFIPKMQTEMMQETSRGCSPKSSSWKNRDTHATPAEIFFFDAALFLANKKRKSFTDPEISPWVRRPIALWLAHKAAYEIILALWFDSCQLATVPEVHRLLSLFVLLFSQK